MVDQGIYGFFVTIEDWHSGWRPASINHSAISIAADGSRSDGLHIKAFPHAIAVANIHAGTMAGKLNGLYLRQLQWLSQAVYLDTVGHLFIDFAFEVVSYPAGKFDIFKTARNFARCVRHDFPCRC